MALPPLHNTPVPYRGHLPMAPTHGSSVIIDGIMSTGCNRFHVNLETDSGDVALHFNPRFEGMNAIIRNTCTQGTWGHEEKQGHFPLALGQPFQIMILIEDQQYKIAVNAEHYCEYRHRIPKDMVRQLTIAGDIQVSQIRFWGNGNLPLQTPAMPVNMKIPGGMKPGKMVRISGQPGNNPKRFSVNFVEGPGFKNKADVGMHFDVRFNYGQDRNIVVRNHRHGAGWGQAERDTPVFPFVPGQPFELVVKAEHDKYMIAVNNQHMYEFGYRMHPMNRFDHLFIKGAIIINKVQFQ